MISVILEFLFKVTGYSLIVWSLWLLVGEPILSGAIQMAIRKFKRKRTIKRLKIINDVDESYYKKRSKLYEHIELTLASVLKNYRQSYVGNFYFLTIVIFIVTYAFSMYFLGDLVIALGISALFSLLPYIYLRFLLIKLRLKTSFAFYQSSHILIQNYQASNRDIYYTIYNSSKEIKDKTMKKILMKLLSALQKERDKQEFKKAIQIFSYTVKSNAATRFANLIEIAHMEDADISLSLKDLQEDIKNRKKGMQKEKSSKVETILMGYFPLLLFPAGFYMVYQTAAGRDIWYYFFQKTPIMIFSISLILTIISALSAYIESKPKTDI